MEPRQYLTLEVKWVKYFPHMTELRNKWFAFGFTPMISELLITVVKPFVCDVITSLTSCVH